ncbi:hypothetical protein HYALB_00011491 [Hymenoscyphus albidus]|uniref:Uncharacterized protein n=1 Tax=Hymenoscyphus albidus TaxID=595503 RepID=A0A9N9LS56_9HELO|nr:hypothetical protein HYALB_00011491 [Hymenoscyphus albidus]
MQFVAALTVFLTTALAAPSPLAPSPEVAALPPMAPEALARFSAKQVTSANISSEAVAVVGKRAITHLYYCQNAGFVQPCDNFEARTGTCYNFINGWNDVVSSAGPDAGTTCTLYWDSGCRGRSVSFVNPGISNLVDVGFNDQASSWRCS